MGQRSNKFSDDSDTSWSVEEYEESSSRATSVQLINTSIFSNKTFLKRNKILKHSKFIWKRNKVILNIFVCKTLL